MPARHGERPFSGADEGDQLADQLVLAVFGGDAVEPRAKFAAAGEKQRANGFAIALNIGLGETVPAHADDVEPDQISERSLRDAPGDHVGANAA